MRGERGRRKVYHAPRVGVEDHGFLPPRRPYVVCHREREEVETSELRRRAITDVVCLRCKKTEMLAAGEACSTSPQLLCSPPLPHSRHLLLGLTTALVRNHSPHRHRDKQSPRNSFQQPHIRSCGQNPSCVRSYKRCSSRSRHGRCQDIIAFKRTASSGCPRSCVQILA